MVGPLGVRSTDVAAPGSWGACVAGAGAKDGEVKVPSGMTGLVAVLLLTLLA